MPEDDGVELLQPVLVGEGPPVPVFFRSRRPWASKAPGKDAPISSRRGALVSSRSWYRASQSMTSPPRERMARRALDLPAPVPPVRPTTTRSLSASTTWKPAAFFSRLPMARAEAAVVRALGEDLRDGTGIKGPQGVEHPLGLDQLVARGAQGVDLLLRKQLRELVKADDAGGRTDPPQDLPGGLLRRAGDHGDRRLGGVVAVLHAWGLGLLPLRQGAVDGLVHVDLADEPLQILQRQSAGPQQPGAGRRSDPGWWTPRPPRRGPPSTTPLMRPSISSSTSWAVVQLGRPEVLALGARDGHPRLPDDGQCHRVVGGSGRPRCPSPAVVSSGMMGRRFRIMVRGPGPELPGPAHRPGAAHPRSSGAATGPRPHG